MMRSCSFSSNLRCRLGVMVLLLGCTWMQSTHALVEIRKVACESFGSDLQFEDIDLLNLTTPLLLSQCNRSDPHFQAIMSALGTKDALTRTYGRTRLNIFPTGPFHLQLGSTLVPLSPVGATTVQGALERLAADSFAFGTTRENPGYTIVENAVASVKEAERRGTVFPNRTTIFADYFADFSSHIFSMGGRNSGAGFHFHQSAWLFLCAGEKEWIFSPHHMSFDPEIMWTGLGKLKSQHDLREIFPEDEVIHALQHPGDLVVLPSFWNHATLNLDEFTIGLGGQQHPELNDRDPPSMVAYRGAFETDDWAEAAAIQEKVMQVHPEDVGAPLRHILMALRSVDVDAARQTYHQLRDRVLDAYKKGILCENDVSFLLIEQLGVCARDGLGRLVQRDEDANGGKLPVEPSPDFLRLVEFQEEVQNFELPKVEHQSWGERIRGGVDKLLGPMCYDLANFAVTYTNADCSTYVRNRALCHEKAECSPHARNGVRHCDVMQGLKHTDACCVCGGGRDFRNAAPHHARKPIRVSVDLGVSGETVAGGDAAPVYMKLKKRRN